jgi:hypothetical protein
MVARPSMVPDQRPPRLFRRHRVKAVTSLHIRQEPRPVLCRCRDLLRRLGARQIPLRGVSPGVYVGKAAMAWSASATIAAAICRDTTAFLAGAVCFRRPVPLSVTSLAITLLSTSTAPSPQPLPYRTLWCPERVDLALPSATAGTGEDRARCQPAGSRGVRGLFPDGQPPLAGYRWRKKGER